MNEKIPATKKRTEHGILPGDLPADKMLDRIIRVDHAGEYGAVRIYQGSWPFWVKVTRRM